MTMIVKRMMMMMRVRRNDTANDAGGHGTSTGELDARRTHGDVMAIRTGGVATRRGNGTQDERMATSWRTHGEVFGER